MDADKSWRVGSYGAGKRHWHISRHGKSTATTYDGAISVLDKRGRVRWFGSREAALKAADRLNRGDNAA